MAGLTPGWSLTAGTPLLPAALPAGRYGQPTEVAGLTRFLALDPGETHRGLPGGGWEWLHASHAGLNWLVWRSAASRCE